MKDFWEDRYSKESYAYGKEPNAYFKKIIDTLFPGKILLAAEGEGRNPAHLPYQAMKGLFNGTKTMYLHATDEKQIVDGISYLKELGIDKIVLVGGNESPEQLKIIKEANIPVIVSRPHRLPDNEDEDPKQSFKLASQLIQAGILVSIDVSGRMERMYTRNLPFYAGSFAAYGIDKEVALQMITLNPAKILGVEKRIGSLSIGKDATLFVSEGDALDMRTNIFYKAYIGGREISLETHQTELWKRYSTKYNTTN